MSMEAGKARGYSGVSDKRRRIDTLSTGETFILGGFSFRVESKLPPTRKVKGTSHYDSSPEERPRNYPTLGQIIGIAGRKAEKNAKSGGDRGQDRDRSLVQAELL